MAWFYALLGWIGGVMTTVAGSWISSKIHVYHENKRTHRDEIKEKVLIPLRTGLEEHFRPLVFHQKPVVFVVPGATTELREEAKVTEDPAERGDVLVAAFPGALVFGPLDPALHEDANRNHFRELEGRVNEFVAAWTAHAGECHRWVLRIAHEILTKSGLEAFPNRTAGPGPKFYVMHYRLAVFIYERLFLLQTGRLELNCSALPCTLNGEECTIATGSREQLEALTEELDRLRVSEGATAHSLRNQAAELQKNFTGLTPALDLAIASKRLRGKCGLVTFF
jgi:hypothetical protein